MKPLILEYTERPTKENFNIDSIHYCQDKNLSVVKGSSEVAITYANLETDTFTKTQGEESDTDRDLRYNVKLLMGTRTDTFTRTETSDSDKDNFGIRQFLDTRTTLESEIESDMDR